MEFDANDPNVEKTLDEAGVVRQLEHIQKPYVADTVSFDEPESPRALATQYLREVAPVYGVSADLISDPSLSAEDSFQPDEAGEKIQLAEEKSPVDGTTTISYQQTFAGLPVWESGMRVVVQEVPRMRVTSSDSSVHLKLNLKEEGLTEAEPKYTPDTITPTELPHLLGMHNMRVDKINGLRLLIYLYEPDKRLDPERKIQEGTEMEPCPPTLPLPPVPEEITPGYHYVVTEVLFTLSLEKWPELNWRAFVEVKTGAVLYLRAFVACATGMIFNRDPVTATGDPIYPSATAAELDPLRVQVDLPGLIPPANAGDPQSLEGEFVKLIDAGPPVIAAPKEPPPGNFIYGVRTDEFSAVNAYYHCDGLFRMMQGMGFDVRRYFDGTAFPVRVDHRALGSVVNAQAPGNPTGTGSDGFRFALAANGHPVGIASDVRVVLHEFGHTLLWDNVHSPNFGFAHSAGDSLAAILCDPDSRAFDPDDTFPWVRINRRHDRSIAGGWAWGGLHDRGGYLSEQILSTTLVRFYRSIGGRDPHVNVKRFSSRYAAYLIMRAIGMLGSGTVTPTPRPDVFATALMNADISTANFEGHPGGAFHKVLRWSFEKQGLYQPAGTPRPVTAEGRPPAVDVYIDDGRDGGYEYKEDFWDNTSVWNRLASDGGQAHQEPVAGAPNYAYVRVKNRGLTHANDVVVRGYQSAPGAALVWPNNWQPLTTPHRLVNGGIAPGGEAVVGPFEWTPQSPGASCLLMAVSATGDLSNIDQNSFLPCANGPIPEWRLVPFDNNLARRNVTARLPAGGGGGHLAESVRGLQFRVENPYDRNVEVELRATLPPLLASRGWGLRFADQGGAAFTLAAGEGRDVTFNLVGGADFDASAVNGAAAGAGIAVRAYLDGAAAGGFSYLLDPRLGAGGGDALAAPDETRRTEAVKSLLESLNLTSDQVKAVRLKRISVEIEF